MPRMNGLQAARELRAMRVRAPIILFTIYADAVPPQDALAAGVDAVVSKTNSFALRQHIESATHVFPRIKEPDRVWVSIYRSASHRQAFSKHT
jgi:CheY-like chemotaxis protein